MANKTEKWTLGIILTPRRVGCRWWGNFENRGKSTGESHKKKKKKKKKKKQ